MTDQLPNPFLPVEISIVVTAMDLYLRQQLEILDRLDVSSAKYDDQDRLVIQIEQAFATVKELYEDVRKNFRSMEPLSEFLQEGAS